MSREKELDDIENEASAEMESKEEILNHLKENNQSINNHRNAPDNEINLGELGTFKKATKNDIDEVFSKLSGTIFRVKSCLFRVSYIKGQDRFTAELING